MLQNRVDPTGQIIFTPERGAWMGNRGVIHDAKKNIIRPYRLKTWITCVLQFKGRHREVMATGRYTELFFMDEATAFSAGHRPCAECRREDYNRFKNFWLKGNETSRFTAKTPIGKIDEFIHSERMNPGNKKKTHREPITSLPDGTFILHDGRPNLKKGDHLYQWSPSGYAAPQPITPSGEVDVLTPRSIVNAFRAGYIPQIAIAERAEPDKNQRATNSGV
jgi:hypothetical protein